MIHKASSSIEEMSYCFWGSPVKFLGNTAKKIVDFDPNWAFPDHYDAKALSFNPGLQYPHLHGPVHTPDNNRWDTPPV